MITARVTNDALRRSRIAAVVPRVHKLVTSTTSANHHHENVTLFGVPQFNRRLVSSESGEEESIGISTNKNETANETTWIRRPSHHHRPVGLTNFTKMLQYQPVNNTVQNTSRNNKPQSHHRNDRNNGSSSGGRNVGFAGHLAQSREQQLDGFDDGTSAEKNDVPNSNDSVKVSKQERPSWRNGRKRYRKREKKQQQQRSTTLENNPRKKPVITTSDWIQVSNTPPMSKLSDLYPSLNQIIEYELQKGIIDLDALGSLDSSVDSVTLNALNGVGALETLYSTQTINDGGVIPLWKPDTSDDIDAGVVGGDNKDSCPMLLEARIHLSYRARPMGWFLRLPNRSVVHAVLNHVRRARYSYHDINLKDERRNWREGLWRGVYDEYERVANEKYDDHEKELMWGEGDTVLESLKGESARHECDDEFMQTSSTGEEGDEEGVEEHQEDSVEDYLRTYTEAFPFPSESSHSNNVSTPKAEHQLLKVGSMPLKIREFLPYPSDISELSSEFAQAPWEQHSFHLSPKLNLSDSVVRVETRDLRINEKDIKFWYRGYEMEEILPVSEEEESTSNNNSTLSTCLTDFPESRLGWNMNVTGNNVNCVIKGIPEAQLAFEPKRKGVPIRANRNTFLVRFATPADARMAVRDTDGKDISGSRSRVPMSVVQYPAHSSFNVE